MIMLNTKEISLHGLVKVGGRSRPRRSIRTCSDSSTGAFNAFLSSASGGGLLAAVVPTSIVGSLGIRLLDGERDIHEMLVLLRVGTEGDSDRGMIRLADGYWRRVNGR